MPKQSPLDILKRRYTTELPAEPPATPEEIEMAKQILDDLIAWRSELPGN